VKLQLKTLLRFLSKARGTPRVKRNEDSSFKIRNPPGFPISPNLPRHRALRIFQCHDILSSLHLWQTRKSLNLGLIDASGIGHFMATCAGEVFIMLLDLMLPDASGFDISKRLKQSQHLRVQGDRVTY
jgi:CheY-like chemotaxis protein